MNRVAARGFTLVEVVVAITILSMIVLGTLSALRTFGRTQVRLDEVSSRTQSLRQVSQFLRRVLTDAQPLQRNFEQGQSLFFYGNDHRLVWVAPFSASRHLGGLTVFQLAAEEGQLTIRFAPYVGPDEPEWAEFPAYILVENLDEFSLGYRASPKAEWLTAWDSALAFPDSLRLSLAAEGRYWPDLIVRLNDVQAPL